MAIQLQYPEYHGWLNSAVLVTSTAAGIAHYLHVPRSKPRTYIGNLSICEPLLKLCGTKKGDDRKGDTEV